MVPSYFPVTAEMTTVPITHCPQRDFANADRRARSPPNLLPVGYREAARPFGLAPADRMGMVAGSGHANDQPGVQIGGSV